MRRQSGIRTWLHRAVAAGGVAALARRLVGPGGVSIFVYHDPSPAALDLHLSWLSRHYSLVPIGGACRALETGAVASLGRNPAVVTIDDGRRGNRLLADVLERHGVRPCVYLCSAVVGTRRPFWDDLVEARAPECLDRLKRMTEAERREALAREFGIGYEVEAAGPSALSREDVAALAPYVDFGSHGRYHQPFRFLTAAELSRELADGRREIEVLTGRACEHLSLPSGAYDAGVLRAVAEAGYRSCRTTEPYVNRGPGDVGALGAFVISDDAALATLQVQAAGLTARARRRRIGRGVRDSAFQ